MLPAQERVSRQGIHNGSAWQEGLCSAQTSAKLRSDEAKATDDLDFRQNI